MIDLSLTKEQMLKGIGASHNAFVNRFSDPLSPDLLSLDEASLVIRREHRIGSGRAQRSDVRTVCEVPTNDCPRIHVSGEEGPRQCL